MGYYTLPHCNSTQLRLHGSFLVKAVICMHYGDVFQVRHDHILKEHNENYYIAATVTSNGLKADIEVTK